MAMALGWALVTVALISTGTPALAADCAAIVSGKVAFHGTALIRNANEQQPVETTFTYQPGDAVKVTYKRADGMEGGYEVVNGHQTNYFATLPKPLHFEYALTQIEGDPSAMTEGAIAKYRDVVTRSGAAAFEEVVQQAVGPAGARKVGDCSFAIVRLYRNGSLTPGDSSRQSKYDYAPSLGISVWNETLLVTKSGPRQVSFEMTSVQDGP
jgi:hypothetical protein